MQPSVIHEFVCVVVVLANSSDSFVADLSTSAYSLRQYKMTIGGQRDWRRRPETSSRACGLSSSWAKGDLHYNDSRSSRSSNDGSELDIDDNSPKNQEDDRSTSVIAQRALKDLEALFVDLDQKQLDDDGSPFSDSGDAGGDRISLEEMTVALNAAIDRYRPSTAIERVSRGSNRKKTERNRLKRVIIENEKAHPLPADILVPLTHFQDTLRQKAKSFRESKCQFGISKSPEVWPERVTQTKYSSQSLSAHSVPRFDLSTVSSVRPQSALNDDSSVGVAHHFRLSTDDTAIRKVETRDQQEQTIPVPKVDQWTETLMMGSSTSSQIEAVRSFAAPTIGEQQSHSPHSLSKGHRQRAPSIEDLANVHDKMAARRVSGLSLVSWGSRSSFLPSRDESGDSMSRRSSNLSSSLCSSTPALHEALQEATTPAVQPSRSSNSNHELNQQQSAVSIPPEASTAKSPCSPDWELDLSNFNP